MPTRLTTTSHAILGLLAIRSSTAYDLVTQYERGLRWMWPASRAHLYAEPKKLVELGLATGEAEPGAGPVGSRTRYAITETGRVALAAWAQTPTALPDLNHEVMLRLAIADQTSLDTLRATLDQAAIELEATYRSAIPQAAGYLADGGPFPGRLHLIALATDFHARFYELLIDWVEAAQAEVATWSSTVDEGLTPGGRALLEGVLERAAARPMKSPPTG